MRIAVDFDETVCVYGKPNMPVIEWLKEKKRRGAKLTLWTCRQGERRDAAVAFCERYGLVFDDIDESKILADIYLDDKAMRPSELPAPVEEKRQGRTRMTSMHGSRQ